MDTTDLTNKIEREEEDFETKEQRRADEEDRGVDSASIKKAQDLKDEQIYNFRQQNIKKIYAQMYEFGLNTDQIRTKLRKISEMFGHLGSVNDLSDKEIGGIMTMFNYLKINQYEF